VQETLPAAGYAVAEQIATTIAEGQYKVHNFFRTDSSL
jgi:hypothetical protein